MICVNLFCALQIASSCNTELQPIPTSRGFFPYWPPARHNKKVLSNGLAYAIANTQHNRRTHVIRAARHPLFHPHDTLIWFLVTKRPLRTHLSLNKLHIIMVNLLQETSAIIHSRCDNELPGIPNIVTSRGNSTCSTLFNMPWWSKFWYEEWRCIIEMYSDAFFYLAGIAN